MEDNGAMIKTDEFDVPLQSFRRATDAVDVAEGVAVFGVERRRGEIAAAALYVRRPILYERLEQPFDGVAGQFVLLGSLRGDGGQRRPDGGPQWSRLFLRQQQVFVVKQKTAYDVTV